MTKYNGLILCATLAVMCCACSTQQHNSSAYAGMNVAELKQQASDLHPSGLYILAGKLFNRGEKDAAVFWFYIGQLRYRVYLTANPELPASGDPAVFTSFNATLGQSINEYAGGDPNAWIQQMRHAKQWDAENPNKFSPKGQNRAAYEKVISGLDNLIDQIEHNKARIRQQREANGLENRK